MALTVVYTNTSPVSIETDYRNGNLSVKSGATITLDALNASLDHAVSKGRMTRTVNGVADNTIEDDSNIALTSTIKSSGLGVIQAFNPAGVLNVTGTTAVQYIEVADLVKMGVKPGDMIDMEFHFSYTGSTNGKTFSLQIGDVAGTLTSLTNTTRNTASELYLIGGYRIWVTSSAQLMKQSSFLVSPVGTNTAVSMVPATFDTSTGPAKLYIGIQLATGSETATLLGYRINSSRGT